MPMVVYFRLTTTSVMFTLDFVLLVMCLELVVCTLKITNYEDSSCPKFITSSLVVTIFVWAGVYYAMMSPGIDFSKPVIRPSTTNKQNASSGVIIIYMLLASESLSLLLFLYIRRWNRRVGKALQRQGATGQSQKLLSMKFQVGETLRVTDVFVPILVVKWALTVLGCLAIYLQRLIPSLVHASAADQAAFFEAVNINYLQGLTTPLLLMYRCDQLGSFLRGSKVTPVEQIVETHGRTNVDDYFKRLESTFNA
ncbi:hypothetical protein AAVH_17187 [Aphelenchoides avenae]|nr:hypothetical protein AAVH_17187 [Aphelenchus avenae]